MSHHRDQISQIRRIQTFNAPDDRTSETDEPDGVFNPAAFVIELDEPRTQSSVQKALARLLDGVKISIETVFDGEEAPTFYRIEFDGVSFEDLSGSPYELAHWFKRSLQLVSCDPDLETDFHPWQFERDEDGFEGVIPFSGRADKNRLKQLCFLPDDSPTKPKDLGWALEAIGLDELLAEHKLTGKGIRLFQIDTGLAKHDELENVTIDNTLGFNLYNRNLGAIDPLKNRFFGWFDQKGHGTATAAVIKSEGGLVPVEEGMDTSPPGRITGVAPGVDYVPVRAIRSVIRVSQSRVAKAINLAIEQEAHIITMSLGGIPSRALRRAISRAVEKNIIVMAASGNCVNFVVYPAAYDECIAVAGVNVAGKRWRGSCRGPEVDFSAPGEFVWTARRKRHDDPTKNDINAGQGTSFSVALSAGVAALWLEHHGRDKLIKSLGKTETLQSRFRKAVAQSAQRMPGWPSQSMGHGIIDAAELMKVDATSKSSSPETTKSSSRSDLPMQEADRVLDLLNAMQPGTGFGRKLNPPPFPDEFGDVCSEIIWRLMREAQRQRRLGDDDPMPARSSTLQSVIEHMSPRYAAIIP